MDYKELKEQKVLLKQIKNLTTIVEQLKLNPLLSMDGEQNFEIIGDLQFSEKEIRKMPRLKDFKIRIMKGKYYEIRFRRYGYDMSFSSKSLDVAKQKAFAWLKMFEQEIQMNHNFAVVREVGNTANKKNTIFGPFALSYMENVKKRMVKANTYQNLCNAFKLLILAKFKSVPIKEITPIVLQTYLSKLHDEKPRLCETLKTPCKVGKYPNFGGEDTSPLRCDGKAEPNFSVHTPHQPQQKKSAKALFSRCGGEERIRTSDRFPYTRFPSVHIRPL